MRQLKKDNKMKNRSENKIKKQRNPNDLKFLTYNKSMKKKLTKKGSDHNLNQNVVNIKNSETIAKDCDGSLQAESEVNMKTNKKTENQIVNDDQESSVPANQKTENQIVTKTNKQEATMPANQNSKNNNSTMPVAQINSLNLISKHKKRSSVMKNRSIISVRNNTTDAQVRKHANKLIHHTHELVEVTFVKKNGTTRTLLTLPCLEWNKLMNKPTTKPGRKGTATKTSHDTINVVEILVNSTTSQVTLQPRSINLSTTSNIQVI